MTVQPNAESLEAAAREVFPQFVAAVTGRACRFTYDKALPDDREFCDAIAQAAITAFLSAERARGVELRPRKPTQEMLSVGELGEPDALYERIWTEMFDAGAQK